MKGKNREVPRRGMVPTPRASSKNIPKHATDAVSSSPRFWTFAAALAAAAIVVFWAYGPSLYGPFLFDDAVLPFALPGFDAPFRVWIHGVRPLLMATYWVNSRLSGDNSYSYHIVNVIIHLTASGLMFFVVRRFLEWAETTAPYRDLLAGFAAVIFLLHPIQAESVAYLAGRSEALGVMVLLAAFAVFLYRKDRVIGWTTTLIVLAIFGAALLSKEDTIALPALLLLTDYWWNPGFSFEGIRRNGKLYGLLALGGLGGVAFFWKLILYSQSAGFNLKGLTWYQYFFTQCRALFVYPLEFLLPARLNADWDFPISYSILDHGAIIGLLALIALSALAWHYRKRYPLASYGWFAYLVLMAPTSSILPIKDPVAERRIYLSMLGLLLILVEFVRRIRLEPRKLAAGMAVIALLFAAVTHGRAAVWADPVSLWKDTAEKSPHKRRVLFQLASAYYDAGLYAQSVEQYRKTAEEFPPDYNLLIDWALACDGANQFQQALEKLRRAASMEPTAHVYTQIAMVYAKRRFYADALDALATAERLNPNYAPIYMYRGDIHAANNQPSEAAQDYRRALQLDPTLEPLIRPKLAPLEVRGSAAR
jgi:tetratricopeptide (TPR) repeat protein